jgi:tetratricopeptide (TPR) repeat protein
LEELKAIFGLEHPHVATSLSNVGTTYGELGQYEEALEYQLKALELRKKILGQEHPDVATSLNNVGVAYGKLGQYEVALEHLQKALEIRQKCFNDNHPLIADCKKHIAWNCQKLGKYDEALIGVEEALIVFKNKDQQKDVTKCEKLLEKILKNQQSLNTTSITKSEELLNKADGIIRLVSYNVTADYFDEEDKTEDGHHHWQFRATFVIKLLSAVYPDIICLQELSPNQALELYEYFGKRLGYSSIFLSQTPSEVKVGAIAHGSEISDWCGKNIGTPLVGTFISKACKFLEVGKFWLNEEPDVVPINTDRGETDKGFGNMNTYRAVLWTKVQIDDSKVLFVFNRVMMELPLAGVLNEQQNKEGYYASDHALVGIDLFWS